MPTRLAKARTAAVTIWDLTFQGNDRSSFYTTSHVPQDSRYHPTLMFIAAFSLPLLSFDAFFGHLSLCITCTPRRLPSPSFPVLCAVHRCHTRGDGLRLVFVR